MRFRAMVLAMFLAFLFVVVTAQGRKVSGVVVDKSRQPVAGATVDYEGDGVVLTTETDDKGAFVFDHQLTRGVVTVSASRFATLSRVWPPRFGATMRFVMVPPSKVEGTVADMMTGRQVTADVALYVRHPISAISNAMEAHGMFRFVDLLPGPAILVAHADGYAPHFRELTIGEGTGHSERIRLLSEAVVTGAVVNPDDALVEGAQVAIEYDDNLLGGAFLTNLVRGRMMTGRGRRLRHRRAGAEHADYVAGVSGRPRDGPGDRHDWPRFRAGERDTAVLMGA